MSPKTSAVIALSASSIEDMPQELESKVSNDVWSSPEKQHRSGIGFFPPNVIIKSKPAIQGSLHADSKEKKRSKRKLEFSDRKDDLRASSRELGIPEVDVAVYSQLQMGNMEPLLCLESLAAYDISIFRDREGRNLLHSAIEQYKDSPEKAYTAVRLLMTTQNAAKLLEKPAYLVEVPDLDYFLECMKKKDRL